MILPSKSFEKSVGMSDVAMFFQLEQRVGMRPCVEGQIYEMRVFSVLGNLAFGVGSSTFCVAGKKFTCELAHCHYVQLEPCDSSFIASHQIFDTRRDGRGLSMCHRFL